MYDLISGTPGAEGAAGRCTLVRREAPGVYTEYVGYFDFRRGQWTLYRRGGEGGRVIVGIKEVEDHRQARPLKPAREDEGPARPAEAVERRPKWWRLPDPPGQIKLEE